MGARHLGALLGHGALGAGHQHEEAVGALQAHERGAPGLRREVALGHAGAAPLLPQEADQRGRHEKPANDTHSLPSAGRHAPVRDRPGRSVFGAPIRSGIGGRPPYRIRAVREDRGVNLFFTRTFMAKC